MSNWFVQTPNDTRSCKQMQQLMDQLLMISVLPSMLAKIGRPLCLIGLFKFLMIRDLAEEPVDGSAFDDFSASSMLAIIGRQVWVMSNWSVQNPNDTRSC